MCFPTVPAPDAHGRSRRRWRRVGPALLAAALAAGVTGCTTDPATTSGPKVLTVPIAEAQQAAQVHRQPPPEVPRVISICYSNLINTVEQVESLAAESCSGPDTRLEFWGEDSLLTSCPLLQPVRATFLCHRS